MIVDFPLVSESNLLDMFQAPQNQTKYVLTQVFMLECVPRIPVSKTNAPEASNSLPGGRTRTAFFSTKKKRCIMTEGAFFNVIIVAHLRLQGGMGIYINGHIYNFSDFLKK